LSSLKWTKDVRINANYRRDLKIKMRSIHVDEFNHDEWASDYDRDVSDESHPIRAGYGALLDWVIHKADIGKEHEVLELGSGSGNLTEKIPDCARILCVDISGEMEALAGPKTLHLKNRDFKKSDILQVFEQEIGSFDTVISTYTIHHLVEEEKKRLFKEIWRVLKAGGTAVLGDLMFENESTKEQILQQFMDSGHSDVVQDIGDEYFWDIEVATNELNATGFTTEVKRFSDLSFGITAVKSI